MEDRNAFRKPIIHWAWIILAVCFANLFINYAIRLGYGVALPEMIRTMGITRKEGGEIFNAYFFAYVLFSPFAGYFTDRFGARVVIPLFGILLGTGTVLMGSVENYLHASIAFAFVGVGAAAMWTPIVTLVQRWFVPNKRGMALGILSTGFGLGFAFTGRFFPIVVSRWDWRYCWYIMGVAAFVMIIINVLFLRSTPEGSGIRPWGTRGEDLKIPPSQPPQTEKAFSNYREILAARRFWVISSSYFAIGATLYVITTFMVDYARYELNYSYDKASFLATLHGLGQVAGVLTIPVLSDRLGRRKTLFLSNLAISVTILLIILAGSNLAMLYTGIGLFGVFFGATFPLYGACGGDYFRKEIIGTVIGAFTPFYAFGAICANWFGGYIKDVSGSFTVPFVAAFLLAIISAVLMLFVKAEK